MKRTLLFLLLLCVSATLHNTAYGTPGISNAATSSKFKPECVVLLHGLGRTKLAMRPIEKALRKEGYFVHNESYPSTRMRIELLATNVVEQSLNYCRALNPSHIHFITHSLGGILVRYYFQNQTPDDLGYIIMLSPPNHGSESADLIQDLAISRLFLGPALQQLGTESNSLPNSLKTINAMIGIITGDRSFEPWFSIRIPGKDDGKVSTESAKLPEMRDYLIVDSGHTFIMRNKYVIEQIQFFLQYGKFKK